MHLVFDGGPLPAKRLEEEGRRARRAAARREGMALLRSGRSADARVQLSRAVDISPLMAAKLIQVEWSRMQCSMHLTAIGRCAGSLGRR